MLEHDGAEDVNAGVVPHRVAFLQPAVGAELIELLHARFLDDFPEAKLVVEKVDRPLGHVLARRHGDEAGKLPLAKALDHGRVRFRAHEDVAVGQQERVVADEALGQFRRLAGAVLHLLPRVADREAKRRAVTEMLLDDLGFPAGDEAELAHALRGNAADDVLEDRLALDRQHRLGQLVGERAHSGAFPGGEDDSLHAPNLSNINALACMRRMRCLASMMPSEPRLACVSVKRSSLSEPLAAECSNTG